MSLVDSLFHPAIAYWFRKTFQEPTPPQYQAWPILAKGEDLLLTAPTGSGKTLAAFLSGLDSLYQQKSEASQGVEILYISPLKALNNDIYHNLERPLQGIEAAALFLGSPLPPLKRGIRTGDTPASKRQKMLKDPPHILITTPESLFLMLSSKASQILKSVRTIIVDEIHTLFPNKRGAHLSISLARLQHLIGDRPIQRIGLSATMAPLEEAAAFLSSSNKRESIKILDIEAGKSLDLKILLSVEDLTSLPEKTIWPSIYRLLLSLIEESWTTLIFVNNRRLAERITANLNHLAQREVARTHHGSISREVRHEVEDLLRRGEIPSIVATSSLELGIDIGSIHQVILIESPKEVARGLQRVGRAGHLLHLTSRGYIIPKNRSDLLEASVLLKEMKRGRIEEVTAPKNPLDVLSQHLVAMPSTQQWQVEEMYQVVTSAYNFSTLEREDLLSLLGMLSGQYETEEYLDLGPRLYWDMTRGVVSSNPYGRRLAYRGVGTIPDRGYYRVQLGEGGVILGELDEEFVYERRIGDRFLLGTSVWRVEEIQRDRVLVSPSFQGEAVVPFWRAEQGGRSFELGRRIGFFLERVEGFLVEGRDSSLIEWLKDDALLSEEVALLLYRYLKEGWEALGTLPTHHHFVVEEFLDELGDTRVILHSPYGYRFHSLLSLLLQDMLKKVLRVEVEVMPGDDGLLLHLPGGASFSGFDWELMEKDLEERVAHLISGTALFGITFRHVAQCSLVLPQGDFKQRKPLYLSRLQAKNLLQVVKKYSDFPLVKETYRELLMDYFPLEEMRESLRAINNREISITHVKRARPSPFALTHLFNFVAGFMYADDSSKEEEGLFGLKPSQLKKMVGKRGFRDIIFQEVIDKVVERAKGVNQKSITKESVLHFLVKSGDVLLQEIPQLFLRAEREVLEIVDLLVLGGQASLFSIGDRTFITTPAKLPYYLRALDVKVKGGYRGVQPLPTLEASISKLILQYARTHGPFTIEELVHRYGLSQDLVREELSSLIEEGILQEGEFLPECEGVEFCEIEILKEIHGRSIARRRKAIKVKGRKEYNLFLSHWHGIGGRIGEDLTRVLYRLQGLLLPAHLWEGTLLPSRTVAYRPSDLDLLLMSGQFYWQARGSSSSLSLSFFPLLPLKEDLYQRFEGRFIEDLPKRELHLSPGALEIKELLQEKGALSLPQLLIELNIPTPSLWEYLEELLFMGLITNDTLGPIRYLLSSTPKQREKNVLSKAQLSTMGRWSLIDPPLYVDLFVRTMTLLNRHGIISHKVLKREDGGFGSLGPVVRELEALGIIKRGYFVEDLGGIQYALPEGVAALNKGRKGDLPLYYTLSIEDPANPLSLYQEKRRIGEWVVFKEGDPLLYASNKKLKIKSAYPSLSREDLKEGLHQLVKSLSLIYRGEKMIIQEFNDQEIEGSLGSILVDLGFERGYRGYVLWPGMNKL